MTDTIRKGRTVAAKCKSRSRGHTGEIRFPKRNLAKQAPFYLFILRRGYSQLTKIKSSFCLACQSHNVPYRYLQGNFRRKPSKRTKRMDRTRRPSNNPSHIKSNNRKQLGQMTEFVLPFLLSPILSSSQTIHLRNYRCLLWPEPRNFLLCPLVRVPSPSHPAFSLLT